MSRAVQRAKPAKKATNQPSAARAKTKVPAGAPPKKAAPAKKAAVAKKAPTVKKAAPVKGDKAKATTPTPPVTKKRSRAEDATSNPPTKRVKTKAVLNSPPAQKLDVYVFGDGESGELGLGPKPVDGKRPTGVKYPRKNALLEDFGVTQVSVGGMHCVSLTSKNEIVTWGVNDQGALGRDTKWEAPTKDIGEDSDSDSDSDGGVELNPMESTPAGVLKDDLGDHTFVQVLALDSASFGLTSTGDVYGWGTFRANDGALGFFTESATVARKTKNDEMKIQRKPVQIPRLSNITSIAAGTNHVLALDDKGRVYTWGAGEQSQLARRISERSRESSLTPARLGLKNVKAIACGGAHSFAIDNDGLVYAWGLNNFGQTGISESAGEDEAIVHSPTIVEALREYNIRHIEGGLHHSIACTGEGKLLIWGRCDESQAGINLEALSKDDLRFDSRGKPRILLKPTVIESVTGVVFVAADIDNSIAVTKEGKAYAWGYSENYRTGLGTEDPVKEPTLLQNTAVKEKKIVFAGCGGQFSLLAAIAEN